MDMKTFLRTILCILFIFCCLQKVSFADSYTDSIQNLLNNCASDTAKVAILLEAANHFRTNDSLALTFFNEAFRISSKENFYRGLGKCYNYKTIFSKNFNETLSYLYSSAEYFKLGENYFELCYIYMSISNKSSSVGEYSLALQYQDSTLKLAKEIGYTLMESFSYDIIGNVYIDLNDLDKALEYHTKAYQIKKLMNFELGVGYSLMHIGFIYHKQKKFDLALENLFRSYSIFKKINYKYWQPTNLTNIGKCYLALNMPDSAMKYFSAGLQKAKEDNYIDFIMEAEMEIGNFLSANNQLDSALLYFNNVYKSALSTNHLKYKYQSAAALNAVYKQLDSISQAYYFLEKSNIYSDSLNVEASKKQIAQMELQYKYDLQDAELQSFKMKRFLYIGSIVFLLLLAFVILRSYFIKKKDNKLLIFQQKEIEHKNTELQTQNDEILSQRDEIVKQKDILQKQNTKIGNSIHYASRIQNALLPTEAAFNEIFKEAFIIFKPCEVVSGDFYWLKQLKHNNENFTIVALADCTGHGVPGAFMSMMGIAFLNEIVNNNVFDENNIPRLDFILNNLRENVVDMLNQAEKQNKLRDGMDMALIAINFNSMKLFHASANNPVYLIRNNSESSQFDLQELPYDKMPVGQHPKHNVSFNMHATEIVDNDRVYLFSDGFKDQFGGEDGRKFLSKNFRNMLLTIQHLPLNSQAIEIETRRKKWQGAYEQVDDISIIGIKI